MRRRRRCGSPSLPNLSLPSLHPPGRGERDFKNSLANHSLFSPEGGVEGRGDEGPTGRERQRRQCSYKTPLTHATPFPTPRGTRLATATTPHPATPGEVRRSTAASGG